MSALIYSGEINIGGEPKKLIIINKAKTHKKPEKDIPIHHIQILDRSASMYNNIDSLIEDCKKTINQMKSNDYYTVIWFSSAGEFRTILKGIHNDTEESRESSFRVLDSIKSTLGCTCFSESIEETEKIIEELVDLCPNFSITLFTDGEAVTPWSTSEEHNRVNKVLNRISDKIIAFNTIGYGNYCNEEILESWAMYSEFGEFIHSSKIDEYHKIFEDNMNRARNLENDPINFEYSGKFYYSTTNTILQMKDHVKFKHSDKDKNQFIIITDPDKDVSFNIDGDMMSSLGSHPIHTNWIPGILYRIAYAEYCYGDRHVALKIFALDLKDKAFADELVNAFSPDEVGNFKKKLRNAAFRDSSLRNMNTCKEGYIPEEDGPCLLELLQILCKNNTNDYVPNDNYKRIGRKTTDEFNMFHKINNEEEFDRCRISDLIFNEKKLNISIRFAVNGYVSINPKQADKVGLNSEIFCKIYRTHTIVKDGYLNMNQISVYVDSDTFGDIKCFYDNCIVNYTPYNGYKNYLVDLDLTKIPIITSSYGDVCIEEVFHIVARQNMLKAKLKIAKAISTISNRKSRQEIQFYNTPEQYKLLEEYGIKNGVYSGIKTVTTDIKDSDFYMSKTFELQFKGFSSLSSVEFDSDNNPVISKPKNGDLYLVHCLDTEVINSDEISNIKTELIQTKLELSAIRIAKVLTGRWFDVSKLKDTKKAEVKTYEDICPFTGKSLTLNIKTAYEKSYF